MNKETFDDVPDVIRYRGRDLFLADISEMLTIKGCPYRFVFADKAGFPHLMQWQFRNNPPIDWQRLEAENTEAPTKDKNKDKRLDRWKAYSKTYQPIKISKLAKRANQASDERYEQFIKWLEEQSND